MNIGVSLSILLLKKGMSQTDLAQALNRKGVSVKVQQVNRWCKTGKIPDYHLVAVCNLFDMKVSELIAIGE